MSTFDVINNPSLSCRRKQTIIVFFTASLKSVDSDWMPGIHSIFGTEPCNDVMAHNSMFEVEVLLAIVVFYLPLSATIRRLRGPRALNKIALLLHDRN